MLVFAMTFLLVGGFLFLCVANPKVAGLYAAFATPGWVVALLFPCWVTDLIAFTVGAMAFVMGVLEETSPLDDLIDECRAAGEWPTPEEIARALEDGMADGSADELSSMAESTKASLKRLQDEERELKRRLKK